MYLKIIPHFPTLSHYDFHLLYIFSESCQYFSIMKTLFNPLKRYTIAGILFTAVLGTLSHFFYEWSGRLSFVGLFTPVSESTWEHCKLLFFPMLIYSCFMKRKLKPAYPGITSSLLAGLLSGSLLIPVLFYTYTGILGFHLLALDIGTFLISIILAFYITYKLTLSCQAEKQKPLLEILVMVFAAAFFLFTFYPPNIGLFQIPG